MNTVTRTLSHHHHWRWLSTPTMNGKQLANPFVTMTRQFLPLCHENCLYVLALRGNFKHDGRSVLHHLFHSHSSDCVEYKVKTGLQDCFSMLEVEEDCTDEELKGAYLAKAKAYHPDSAASTADPYKFSQIKDAYKAVLEHRKGRELMEEEEKEAEVIFDIKHTAPQHRQYLEFEGVGFGTPSQRQRQYQQHRVVRVTENVFQHRMQRLAVETEDALVVKDKQQAKKVQISNALHRIVEDLIQESMQRGDFNNLPGQGRPLPHSGYNPFVDATTHNLNKILADQGFAPEWIMLQSEIRKELLQARQALAMTHSRLEKPHTARDAKTWKAALNTFKDKIEEVNVKIGKFNLIVPFLNKQKVPYVAEREVKRVLENLEDYLHEDDTAHLAWNVSLPEMPSSPTFSEPISWGQVWRDIKHVFKSSKDTPV